MKQRIATLALFSALTLSLCAETLYNGIELPAVWPPKDVTNMYPAKQRGPMRVPYLENRPAVVPIDLGRQLFVDNFLIEETTLERIFPKPQKYEGNPILKPETKWELNRPRNACTVPKGGGVWWDAKEKIFKLWYEAGWIGTICYATSRDGLHWERPSLDVAPGSNRVLPTVTPDSWSVVPVQLPSGELKRAASTNDFCWAMFLRGPGGVMKGRIFTSYDGIHWTDRGESGTCADRSSMFYNPFRQKWIYSLRGYWGKWPEGLRSRHYREHSDFVAGAKWNWDNNKPTDNCVLWAAPDKLDPEDAVTKFPVQLYSLDAVAYESIMLGFYELHHGPENHDCEKKGLPKITDLCFTYSRDGFHWDRPDRTAAIASERWGSEKWDTGYVQAAANLCVIRDEKMWFYYGAFHGDKSRTTATIKDWLSNGMYDNGSMGVAWLRRDGFAGMRAKTEGTLLTRPIKFSGAKLFVNLEGGSLATEVLSADGKQVLMTLDKASGDNTKLMLGDVSKFANQVVRLRFTLKGGTLYSFWVSKDARGASTGYLAGGGPDYSGLRDL